MHKLVNYLIKILWYGALCLAFCVALLQADNGDYIPAYAAATITAAMILITIKANE